jgi:hypothetical protein
LDGTTSLEELCNKIKGLMPNRPKVFIGIDGMNGVGKTPLARNLAPLLDATVIPLDNHLDRNRGAYVPCIRCQEVTAALGATGEGVVIVDGVCLRAVAERCGFAIDVHIYVKQVNKETGLWHDADLCLAETSADDLKRREREYRRLGAVIDGEVVEQPEGAAGLHEELIDYHAQWRPSAATASPRSVMNSRRRSLPSNAKVSVPLSRNPLGT